MLERLRHRLTYANVMSSIAVFAVLAGGGAYAASKIGPDDIAKDAVRSRHIKKNQVTGKHVREASLRGVGLGVLGGEWESVGSGNGGNALSALGGGAGSTATNLVAPVRFKVARFRVRLGLTQTAGTRTFQARIDGSLPGEDLCTISAGESSCASQAPVTIPAGARLDFWVSGSGASPASPASFGWQAVR